MTVYQEGTATAAAMIGNTKYIGDKEIRLAPGKYNCSVGPINAPYARFMTIIVEGKGVYGNANQYPAYIEVSAGADAIVTLEATMPGRPTVKLHIRA